VIGPVRLVLDTTAVAAFAEGSPHVGEPIREICDEGAAFAVPVLCLAEAGATARSGELPLLDVLAAHAHCVRVALPDDWRTLSAAARVYGSVDRGAVAIVARAQRSAYVLTAEPDTYAGLPVIGLG
jgi:hypothetical protein